MPNFKDALKVKASEVERPPATPIGHYRFAVKKLPVLGELTGKDGTKYDLVDYSLQAIEAMDDVNADELATFGGFKNVTARRRFMFDTSDQTKYDRSLFDHRQFLEQHLKCWDADATMQQAMNASVNKQCVGLMANRPNPDNPEQVFSEIRSTAPVE